MIDAVDNVEKTLLEMIGGGSPAPRADLRFGLDDFGRIYLLTKRDGTLRRIAGVKAVPALQPAVGLGLILLLAGVAANRTRRPMKGAVFPLDGPTEPP